MTLTAVPATSDATFADDVLHSAEPVLVDFGATWCGPCRMLEPVLQQVAADEADRMRVVSLDVDENPTAARTYQILGMPTLILFRNGSAVARLVGARPRAAVLQALEPHLTRS